MDNTEYKRKPISGFYGYYIDTNGDVWSHWQGGHKWSNTPKKKAVWIKKDQAGYGTPHVHLYIKNKDHKKKVSKMVALAFLANPSNKPLVCHKDSNTSNNNVDNLYWGTAKENMQDRMARGLYGISKGENNGSSKLTEKEVIKIKRKLNHKTNSEIAKEFGVTRQNINFIRKGATWKHV